MRWRRRRFSEPKKRHFFQETVNGVALAFCKKEADSSLLITSNVHSVNCKSCIKKMIKNGLINIDEVPSHLLPTAPVAKEEKEEKFDTAYLKRLGVF